MIAPPSPALSLLGAAHFRLALGCRPNTGFHDCIFERTPRRRRDPQPYMLSATKIASPVLYINSRSEEHTSELQSLMRISYAVFCLNKKNTNKSHNKHKK